MGIITYNGISSRDVGIVVERHPDYVAPVKHVQKVHVPGRNGDVILFTGEYENVERSYDIAFGSHKRTHSEMARAVSEWLYSASDYVELYDSYEPDIYRMAIYDESAEFENMLNHLGRATITFNCKPQRFLRSGKNPIIFETNDEIDGHTIQTLDYIQNPTGQTALPIVTIEGRGSCTVIFGNTVFSTLDIGDTPIILDSEFQDAYYETENKNSLIVLSNGFPRFEAGRSQISIATNNTRVEVIPRWWTL